MARQDSGIFNINYGVASVSITTTGAVIIATTSVDYHGITAVGGTTQSTIYVYDNASTTTGNMLDVVRVNAGGFVSADRFIPVHAKNGVTITVTGTGLFGTIFYSPKG
jgi:hypothetical protein